MLENLLTALHVLVALFMILVVLVQGGNQGGVGAAFGGGNSSGVFGATGATSLLGKLTYGAAAVFVVTSLWLTRLQGKGGDIGLKERLRSGATAPVTEPATTPAATTAPVENTAAPAAADTTAAPAATAPAPATPATGTTP